jgi:hypothetical protein
LSKDSDNRALFETDAAAASKWTFRFEKRESRIEPQRVIMTAAQTLAETCMNRAKPNK